MKKLVLAAAAAMAVASSAIAHNYNGVRLYQNLYHNEHNKLQWNAQYRSCVYKPLHAGRSSNIIVTVKGLCPYSIMYHPESRTWHR